MNKVATLSTTRATLTLLALALAGISGPANAQNVFYPNNATVSTDLGNTNVIVGYANATDYNNGANPTNGTSPTVNFVTGSAIEGNNNKITVWNSSTVNVSGGTFTNLTGTGTSQINISGGVFSRIVQIGDGSTGTISGGTIAVVTAIRGSTVTISGGTMLLVNGAALGTINVTGGSAKTYETTSQDGTLNLYGTGLSDTLVGTSGAFTVYTLQGTLEDGTSITGDTYKTPTFTPGTINFHNAAVPEFSTNLLFAGFTVLGGLFLRRR